MPSSQKILIPLLLALFVGYFSVYKVNEYEQAIVFEFRKIKRSDHQPGLHFMWPLINNVQKFQKAFIKP